MAEIPPPGASPSATPPPPAPAADTTDKIKTEHVPALMKMLMADVSEEEASGDPEKKKGPAKKPDEPKPGDPPAAPKPGDAPPPEPGMKVRRKKNERPPLPTVDDTPPPPPPPPRAPVAAHPSPDAEASKKFEEGLEENEREMLADAKYLEQNKEKFGEKYKGMTAKVEKFLRDNIAWTEKPDFDDQDPEYLRWVQQNAPQLSRAEIRQIEEARIADNLRKENDTRFADLNFRTFAKEKEPEIERLGQQAYAEMTNSGLPDDLNAVLREHITKLGPQKGYEEAMKTHKMEIETAEGVLIAAAEDIKEFNRLNVKDPTTGRTLVEFIDDPSKDTSPTKEKYQQHQRLANMVDGVCESFKNDAGEDAIRDGKWFVTRKEWLRLRPEARGRFWTFTNKEIIDRAKAGIKGVISAAIAQKHEYLKARGWTRAAASSAAPPTPAPTSSPKAPPAPAPVPGPTDAAGGVSAAAKGLAATLERG